MNTFSTKETTTVFESLHVLKFIPYELFWICVGLIIFVSGELAILHLGENDFLVPQIFFCLVIGCAPIFYKLYYKSFLEVSKNLNVLFEFDNDVWNTWINNETKSIFTLKHSYAKAIILSLWLSIFLTFIYIPLPFHSLPLQVYSIIGILIVATVGGIFIQFTIALLIFLRKLSNLKTVARFYLFPHPELTKLNRYFSTLAILIALGYFILVFSVWFSPYGFNFQMLIWLSILALYPLTLFGWSFYHIHLIQHNIKFSFIELINQQVNQVLSFTIKEKDSTSLEKLDRFMTIQSKLHELKEFPFELSGLITFIATSVITIIQLYIAFKNK